MKDLEKQLSEGGLSAHDLEKAKKKLEMEKEELNAALEVCIEGTRLCMYLNVLVQISGS